MLAKRTDAAAAAALEGVSAKRRSIAEPMRQTLPYDRGKTWRATPSSQPTRAARSPSLTRRSP